ncbi:hypothetical protein NMH_0757 [Neisseria meningitidis H44/76]|uniref:Uncharacterized protein n=5 Tax=Neisseria meningitidis TaxID=487 RepID=A0A0H5QA48_NEIMI|nr:hypothetical protein NMA510612_0839 [Neisseria meningitidis]EFV64377.1 hypothetical protein NMH_0757 [Neisseria meningitidis H44/76]KER40344.1 hypothetical protein F528_0673 [Neisseria meningitidis 992008]CBA09012.1 hypothetical protein predicted by Glimmer/Critica [Neisseria meningitidis alpha153]CCA45301.1 hypothetical protein NMALPHA522_1760 [Neisseria meningitidis alpha522]CRY98229.1 hypothetical protein [Neisseria meningitidis serogroup B]
MEIKIQLLPAQDKDIFKKLQAKAENFKFIFKSPTEKII